MKTLSNISMSDFISIYCGHHEIIFEEGDDVSPEELCSFAQKLIYDYSMIVNPAQARTALVHTRNEVARTTRDNILTMCLCMLDYGDVAGVEKVLDSLGYSLPNNVDVLKSRIESEKRRLEYERLRSEMYKKNEVKRMDEKAIHEYFDKEQASVMSYFRMQIDINTITASVYANLVAQALRELKAKRQALIRK